MALTLNPNPVSSGSKAVLSVSSEGLPADALNGIAALWQCWNGSGWISTHALFRGVAPCQDPTRPPTCGEPSVRALGDPYFAIGLGVPNAFPILVPDVPAGVYRIQDTVLLPNPLGASAEVTGVVIVWVR